MSGRRLASGGTAIDREASLRFRFDGVDHDAFAGDTLASALLAEGIEVVASSPILGRPRGVMSAGVEEASAFAAVLEPWVDVIAPATTIELVDGLVAESRAGVGRLPQPGTPTTPAMPRSVHVETLVIGGGPSGLAAATAAGASSDERIMVLEERPSWGGSIASLESRPDTTLLDRTSALGIYDDGLIVAHRRTRPTEQIWHVRAGRVIVATGATERPIAFRGNDLPGVMLASAAATYVERFGVLPGSHVVIFTTNDSTKRVEQVLRDAGAEVEIADVREGWTIETVSGEPSVQGVRLRRGSDTREVEADLVAVSGGWNPSTQLARAIGAGLRFDERMACFVPTADGPDWLTVVGTAAGEGLPQGTPYWYVPAEDLSHHYVDLQRDQTVADVLASVGRGLRSVEHIKRDTYIGTAIDQGRTSGVLTAEIVNQTRGEALGAQGPTNARPPSVPVAYATLAGLDRGMMLDPVRTTPIHPWHVAQSASFENVGQWKRPWYFPQSGEDLDGAVQREALAVRERAGVLDASTLGKIDVVGPDAGAFLDRMYTNRMSSLALGSIRYGLLLGLDGMVFDDGTAIRLADDHFLVTTTTGGAAKVLDHFEEFLQTEWPDLRVYCTSVTEQWATIALAGPQAREILANAGTDISLGTDAFPFMTWREGAVSGMRARVCRISFTGELSYEINVAGTEGRAMWEAVIEAGRDFGLLPYGTETMHLLRAEKGFVIVGQDTDGTVTPGDLGMNWIVNMDKGDFIGRRSLRRPDTVREDRKQLVGLLTDDAGAFIPEGAQLVDDPGAAIPMPMVGHVTSSYRSPVLGRAVALAMLAGGRSRIGERVYAPLPDATVVARVVEPVFYDPEGARRDG